MADKLAPMRRGDTDEALFSSPRLQNDTARMNKTEGGAETGWEIDGKCRQCANKPDAVPS